jgi:hypothetical protein
MMHPYTSTSAPRPLPQPRAPHNTHLQEAQVDSVNIQGNIDSQLLVIELDAEVTPPPRNTIPGSNIRDQDEFAESSAIPQRSITSIGPPNFPSLLHAKQNEVIPRSYFNDIAKHTPLSVSFADALEWARVNKTCPTCFKESPYFTQRTNLHGHLNDT